ncbi:MAG: hypothetical protein OXG85_02765 [Chloroflexi bacterium]|nr:hypothetical protein [Chloroflexota bacterium]
MKRISTFVIFVCALLMFAAPTFGQGDTEVIEPKDPDMMDPAAHISFPPPVYVVRGSVDIRGTVILDIMRNFYIEFRPLDLDMMGDAAAQDQWFPATLPRIEAVADDILGSWNTMTLDDGLYELRLTVNIGGDAPLYYRVSPIRVENRPMVAAAEEQAIAMDEPEMPSVAEPAPEADGEPGVDPMTDPSPRVIATVNSNVRAGDSTQYGVIGHLLEGQSAPIRGISSFATRWWYIELANGRRGFIFPGIVRAEGDLSNLPRINPPPLPPTPVPIPTAMPAPQQPQPQQPTTGPDLYIEQPTFIDPHPVSCGQTYKITVTVRNGGSAASTSGGLIEVRDSGNAGSAAAETTRIAFGALAPGQAQTVFGALSPTVHVETLHHINMFLDVHNQVAETNENNNLRAERPYILGRGSC